MPHVAQKSHIFSNFSGANFVVKFNKFKSVSSRANDVFLSSENIKLKELLLDIGWKYVPSPTKANIVDLGHVV